MGLMSVVQFPGEANCFPTLNSFQTDSRTHTTAYTIGAGPSFPGVKGGRILQLTTPPSSAEAKNGRAVPSLPSTSSWHLHLPLPPCDIIYFIGLDIN
jgi:hypothetical protein